MHQAGDNGGGGLGHVAGASNVDPLHGRFIALAGIEGGGVDDGHRAQLLDGAARLPVIGDIEKYRFTSGKIGRIAIITAYTSKVWAARE
jgi:hypothetical protein